MFGFGKKKTSEESVVVPSPSAEHYALTDSELAALKALKADKDGFAAIGDVTHGLLHQQSQYISRYMDGSVREPNLVEGLRVDVTGTSHHDYRIHQDDALEFVARVRAWRQR